MRIAIIGHHVAPVAAPFIGGVEAHTDTLARGLAARGHDVTLFAPPGSEVPGVRLEELALSAYTASPAARCDVSAQPAAFMAAHHAYLDLMLRLQAEAAFDVIHVNTLHYLPVAMSPGLPTPALLVLHCPPTPWLESALTTLPRETGELGLIAVSHATAEAWRHLDRPMQVIGNGVDPHAWPQGEGGRHVVWAGRIVPEKAPHEAILAARAAGYRILLAGPVIDHDYHRREVLPLLGADARHVGHLGGRELADLFGGAAVCIQAPVWDEPFGLVACEAMMTGTPVAAYARGGLRGLIGPSTGALAVPGDVTALAAAIERAARLPRPGVRAAARAQFGRDAMLDAYEHAYAAAARRHASRRPLTLVEAEAS